MTTRVDFTTPDFDPDSLVLIWSARADQAAEDAYYEWLDDMSDEGPATSLSDAHSHWHAVNGWDKVCDLDCGAGEV